MEHQLPASSKGAVQSQPVRTRIAAAKAPSDPLQWFPATPPTLAPYLANLDEFGNTAEQPGALLPTSPLDAFAQAPKSWVSEVGLRYSLEQSLTLVSMTDVMQGNNTLGFYSLQFLGKWSVLDAPQAGTAGWLSTEFQAKAGVGEAGETQSAQSNLGTVASPTGIWPYLGGFRVPEAAWQQSFHDGRWVAIAGVVDQGNYFDANSYANNGRGQFLNAALINSLVFPMPNYNLGLNLQWQPRDQWYALASFSAGNRTTADTLVLDFTWDHWTALGEVGYTPANVLGLGPGVYRIQPFLARNGGAPQAGLCFNLQQQLGPQSPFGWFGRFGFGGSQVTAGAAAQIATGFVMQAPLMHAGLVPALSNDLLGLGLVWSQPSATTTTIHHHNEQILEAFYALQITPLMKLQPDLQYFWNPAFNPVPNALVAQLQLVFSW